MTFDRRTVVKGIVAGFFAAGVHAGAESSAEALERTGPREIRGR
jgi:hypothetical protein